MKRLARPGMGIAALALVSLMGCGTPLHFEKKEYHGHFRSEPLSLCLQVPTTWEIREGLPGVTMMSRSPLDGPGDTFRENLVLQELKVAPGSKPEDWVGSAVAPMKSELQSFHELERGLQPAPWVLYSHQESGQTLQSKSYFVQTPKAALELTYTATDKSYAEWLPRFEAIQAGLRTDLAACDHPGARLGSSTPGPSGTPAAAPPAVSPTPTAASASASATPAVSPTPEATVSPAVPTASPTESATPAAPSATPVAESPAPASATPAVSASPPPPASPAATPTPP